MRSRRVLVIAFSLFLCIFLQSVFEVAKASSQTAEKPAVKEMNMKEICLLGQKVSNFPFYVYKDGNSSENNFFPTGNMGDLSSYDVSIYFSKSPYAGSSCIRIKYQAKEDQRFGWAGLYWQYPPNNWGNIPKAFDLTGAKKLTFWARGEFGGEVISKFQVGGITGKYRDSGVASIGPIILSSKWQQYTIDLARMDNSIIVNEEDKQCWPFMEPLSRIVGGFCWATSMSANDNKTITFYLDEIKFEN